MQQMQLLKIGADYTTTVKYEPDKLSTFVGKDKVGVNNHYRKFKFFD